MNFIRSLLLLAFALGTVPSFAQSVPLQGGPWAQGHAPMYSNSGNSQPVISDSGPASGGDVGVGMSEGLYVAQGTGAPPYVAQGTGPNGTNWCDYDAPITSAAGYHYLCLSPNAGSGGLIVYGAGGTAQQLPLNIVVNGATVPLAPPVYPVTCNGIDDTSALQNALNAVKSGGGGVLELPAGTCVAKATLVYDISDVNTRFTDRLNIIGQGAASSTISFTGLTGAAFSYLGNSSNPESYLKIEGVHFTGSNTVGSSGISLSVAAFVHLTDVVSEAFDYDLDATDVEQSLIEQSNFRWGMHGVRFNPAVKTTSANSITFINSAIANNSVWGLQAANPNAFSFLGGSVQYNGTTTGSSSDWGVKFIEAGNGYGTITFNGVAFEGNTGISDFISDQSTNPANVNILGCGFARSTNVNYSTNNILLTGSNSISTYQISNDEFRGYNNYVPDASRPYIALTNGNAKFFDDGTNIYGSSLEAPPWLGWSRSPTKMLVGAGATPVGGSASATIRAGTDENLYVGGTFSLGSGVSLGSLNDAHSTLLPIEIRASNTTTAGSFGSTPVDLTLVNGSNGTISPVNASIVRISGPTSSFSILGIAAGFNGQRMTLFDSDSEQMTISNDNGGTAVGAKILTLSGADLVLRSGKSAVTLYYSSEDQHWIVTNSN